jgi:uncharacterized protein YciI
VDDDGRPLLQQHDRQRFAYVYFMKHDPERIRVVAPRHVSHWKELRLGHYLGGPFDDRTGGLITFDANDTSEAERAVREDPFVREGLVETQWLKQWTPE